MCHDLEALRHSMVAYAGRFDARCLTPGQAAAVVQTCAQIEASVASVKALAAARCADGNGWRHDGYRSPADQLAHQAGMSPAAAKRALETGRRMVDHPDVACVALAGELSSEQVAAVAEGAAANPAKTTDLIDKARHSSLPELNEEVARVKAASTDPEDRRRAIHSRRSLRRWTDRDGAMQAHLYGHPDDGARLWRMLDPIRRRLTILRRATAQSDTLDALDYDAIMTMASIAAGRDTELGLGDLLELGLFPQLDAATLATRQGLWSDRSCVDGEETLTTKHGAEVTSALVGADLPVTSPRPDVAGLPGAGPPALLTSRGSGPSAPPGPEPLPLLPPRAGGSEGFRGAEPVAVVQRPDAGSAKPAGAQTSAPVTSPGSGSPEPAGDRTMTHGEGAGHVETPARAGPPAAATRPSRGRRAKKLAGSPLRVMVRVDLDTLLRGVPLEGELCEIPGYGPVPVSVIEDLLATESPFIVGLLTKGQQLVGVYHHGRHPNAHQRSALDFLYPTCAVQGCSARAGLQYDHRLDFAATKLTAFDLLDRLCPHHHRQKTHQGWALVQGRGKRAFVPPDDPRHPRHAPPLEDGSLSQPCRSP